MNLSAKTSRKELFSKKQSRKTSSPRILPTQTHTHEKEFCLPVSISRRELLDDNGVSDHHFRQLLYDFSALGSSLETARAYLSSLCGLTSPQYNVVMIIAQHQGTEGIGVTSVAQYLHVTTAFITLEAHRLVRSGWIEKRKNPNDGRGTLLRLTHKGETNVRRIAPQRLIVNDHLFGKLSKKDFQHLAQTFAVLIQDFTETVDILKIATKHSQRVKRARSMK